MALFLLSVQAKCAGTWIPTGPMILERSNFSCAATADGKVVVAGGFDNVKYVATSSCELYDPVGKVWGATGSLTEARSRHCATRLANGNVLVSGGYGGGPLSSCEVFKPDSWTKVGSMSRARVGHTATLLANGNVLVAGGGDGSSYGSEETCELYSPLTRAWSATGSMAQARAGHAALLLQDGKVLVIGGGNDAATQTPACELYDPASKTWSATGSLLQPRTGFTATLLDDGRALVAGGYGNATKTYLSSCELYDPATAAWVAATPLSVGRTKHTARLLPDGKVLVAGGLMGDGAVGGVQYATCGELFDASTGSWGKTNSITKEGHRAALLADGTVLAAGGDTLACVLYDPDLCSVAFKAQSALMGTVAGSTSQLVQAEGSTTPVTASPKPGHQFVNWTGDNGFETTTQNPLTIADVRSSMTVTANFVGDTYTLSYAAGEHGALEGATSQTVMNGGWLGDSGQGRP